MRFATVKKIVLFLLALMLLPAFTACNQDNANTQDYLVRVGDVVATRNDFNRFWEAYVAPIYANADSDALSGMELRQTKQEAFDQFVITMLLQARAHDLGIMVTNEELDNEMGRMREDYTEEVFRDTLVKAAIPFDVWRDGLGRRLLMEKVMRADLYAHGEITPEDVERFGGLRSGVKVTPEEVLERVYRAKAENDFQRWTEELQYKYPVDINFDQWLIVLNDK